MKKIIVTAGIFLLLATAFCRETISLAPEWKFSGLRYNLTDYPVDQLPADCMEAGFDDSSWSMRAVPANWNEDLKESRSEMYMTGVYRQTFTLPAKKDMGRVLLRFDGAAYDTHLWVNGKKIGMHRGAYAEFYFDITPAVNWNDRNVLAVRCDFTNDKSRRAVLNNWPTPGDRAGLWGKVWIELVPELYIRRVLVDPELATDTLRLRATVVNESGKAQSVAWNASVPGNASGKIGTFLLQPGTNLLEGKLQLKNPKRWSHEDPALHHLISTIELNEKQADMQIERFGFSRFEIDGQRFRFNRVPIFLKARHFNGVVLPNGAFRRCGGFSMSWEEQKKLLLELFKAQHKDNVNMLRAHSAHGSPKFVYDAADETGLLIYQEWSTYGVGKNLAPKYLKDAADEIEEFLFMVYNNPSVVMFSFANESPGFEEQTRCYDMVKPVFGERFAFCSSSGFLPLLSGKINVLPKTDLVDIHTYVGMSFRVMMPDDKVSWQRITENLSLIYKRIRDSWRDQGKEFALPYVAMEIPAGSWNVAKIDPPKTYLAPDDTIPPESYIRAKELSERQGALPLGAWDMKNASLADKFAGAERNIAILNKIDKRSIEGVRRNPDVSGLCVAGANPNVPTIQSLVYQDVLPVIEEQDFNRFAGETWPFTLMLINDSPHRLPPGELRLSIRVSDRTLIPLGQELTGELCRRELRKFTAVEPRGRKAMKINLSLPKELKAGDYRLDLEVMSDGKSISRNSYLLYIGRQDAFAPIRQGNAKILLLDGENGKMRSALDRFGVDYTLFPAGGTPQELVGKLAGTDVAVIAPSELKTLEKFGPVLRGWAEKGGRIISFELKGSGKIPWCADWELGNEGPAWFADIGPGGGHPISKGLKQEHFDSWNGSFGHLAENMILPMNLNMLAVGVCVESDQLGVPVAEAKVGKGRIMVSQLMALDRFMTDSVATTYLHNILDYFLTGECYSKVRPLTAGRNYSFDLDFNKCFFVDLKPYANRGFTDRIPGDRTGWTDQGENDLRHIPQGKMEQEKRVWEIEYNEAMRDKQIFRGVPFAVIDQAENNGKSCIVLRGELRRDFPLAVRNIKVGRKAARLYFLHTAVFGHSAKVGEYRIRYQDGSFEVFELRGKHEIADWWGPQDLTNALLAWSEIHPVSRQTVGVYACEFQNPHPEKEISSIDFVSNNKVVPILLAITGVAE